MKRIHHPSTAGTLLLLAGSAILLGIVTAEALYPAAYRTDENTISDLGGTRPPDSVVLQPSAAIFDATMVVTGLMIVFAAYLIHRGLARRATAIATGLLGLGVLGVGVFPGNTGPHPAFAMLAFIAGGIAAIASSRALAPPLRYVFAGDGAIALTALAVGVFLLDWAPVASLGEGGVERWVAYPVVLWLVGFGANLATAVPGGARTSGARAEVPAWAGPSTVAPAAPAAQAEVEHRVGRRR
ncbi:MAG TPA: DUF998 domain-containing protein [Micromonosporaceae bacterium]|nr:DUF998 domain-containing protein [Micromonosporaceae bacterium]